MGRGLLEFVNTTYGPRLKLQAIAHVYARLPLTYEVGKCLNPKVIVKRVGCRYSVKSAIPGGTGAAQTGLKVVLSMVFDVVGRAIAGGIQVFVGGQILGE